MLQAASSSVQEAAAEAAVADGLISSSSANGNSDDGAKARKANLRRGKWTTEEEYYANRLIFEFKLGLLPLTDGTTLRTFLSKLLNCDPMRISKKFVGQNCIGKQVFRRRQQDLEKLTTSQIEQSRKELADLERKFLERVAQTNRAKSSVGGVKSVRDGKMDYEDENGNAILAPWMIPPDETQSGKPGAAAGAPSGKLRGGASATNGGGGGGGGGGGQQKYREQQQPYAFSNGAGAGPMFPDSRKQQQQQQMMPQMPTQDAHVQSSMRYGDSAGGGGGGGGQMSQQQQGQQQSLQQQYLQQQYHQQQQYLMYQQQQQQQHQQQQGMGGSADQGGYGGGGGFGPLLGYSGGYMSAQGGSSGSSGGGDGGAGLPRVDSMDILKTISHIASTDSLVGWDKGGSQLDLINFGSTDVLSNLARDGSEMNLGDWPSFSNLVALADGRQEGVEEDSPSAEAGPVRSGRLGSRQAGQAVEQAEAQRVRAPIMDYSAPIAQSSMAAMAHMYNGGHQPAEGGGGAGTARSGAGPSKGEGSSAGRAAPLARRETSNGSSRSALPLVDVKSEGAGRGGGGLPKNSSVEDFWVGDLPMPDQNLQSSGPGAVDAGAAQRGASSSSTVAGLVKAEEGTVSFAVSNTGAPNGNPPFIPRASDRDHQVGMLDKTKRELSVGDGLDQGMGVTLVTKKPKTEAP